MGNKEVKEKKIDRFEDIINILKDYEKNTPKAEGKVSSNHIYENCMCGSKHGDERDKEKEHAYHLSELTDEPITKEDIEKRSPLIIKDDEQDDEDDEKEEEE
ncbi:hypothetical protein HYY69_02395 [Candidatus Woesearchaeota archaeon]|nr:hypothetical protein [Candidatus Woesearchaeota archaeon]